MRTLILIMTVAITAACGSQNAINKMGPLPVDQQPYAQKWTGGIPGSGSGINVFIPKSDIAFDHIVTVYFQNRATDKIELIDESNNTIIARFATDFNKRDINMNLDPAKEYGNEVDLEDENEVPFEMRNDELIVKYCDGKKWQHMKFENVQFRESQDRPSRPQ